MTSPAAWILLILLAIEVVLIIGAMTSLTARMQRRRQARRNGEEIPRFAWKLPVALAAAAVVLILPIAGLLVATSDSYATLDQQMIANTDAITQSNADRTQRTAPAYQPPAAASMPAGTAPIQKGAAAQPSRGQALPGAQPLTAESSQQVAEQPEERGQPIGVVITEHAGVNPWVETSEDNESTFALDGDSASWDLAILHIREFGTLPDPALIRVEEFVNAINQGYENPETGLAIEIDGGPSIFGRPDTELLRVGIASSGTNKAPRPPVSLILVIDVSGSMEGMPVTIAQHLATGLTDLMQSDDRVGLITYGSEVRTLGRMQVASEADNTKAAVMSLQTGGGTPLAEALQTAYDLAAEEQASPRGNGDVRIVVISDGVGNIGATDPEDILRTVTTNAKNRAYLTAIGVAQQNLNDHMMETLANRGNGTYHYVSSIIAAQEFMQERADVIFRDAPRDARAQVEFNPEAVERYRLIGYENRDVPDDSFRDDTMDFGEPGFARDVTALYELELNPEAKRNDALATVYLRWQLPGSGEQPVAEIDEIVTVGDLFQKIDGMPASLVRTAAAAELAEILRQSEWGECENLPAISTALNRPAADGRTPAQLDRRGSELVALTAATKTLYEGACE